MTTCQELEPLLSLRATGDLSEDEASRVELHLASCAACRAGADEAARVLRAVRLPPPTDADRRATSALARSTLAELHRREGRASSWKRAAAGFLAAAAVIAAVLAPALVGRRVVQPPAGLDGAGEAIATAATSTWEPDLDAVWGDTAILDEEASVTAADASDAALASLDL